MAKDLKESLLMIAKNNTSEFNLLMQMSVENFLIKYKVFIDEIEVKQNGGSGTSRI